MFKGLAAVAAVSLALACAGSASAATVLIYNTGEGLAAGDGQADSNYTIVAADYGALGAAKTYTNISYRSNDADSRWVSSGTPLAGDGYTTFETTFDLTGFDAASANLSGMWGADNEGVILLNGHQIGELSGTVTQNFRQLWAFGATDFFQNGLNVLRFIVHDTGGPTAFRTDDMVITANLASAVPEPATWAMMITGFGLAGGMVRRRKASLLIA